MDCEVYDVVVVAVEEVKSSSLVGVLLLNRQAEKCYRYIDKVFKLYIDSVGLDFVNRHVANILLAVEDGDSINRVSEKIDSSYSYTYEWVDRLEEIGVFERDDGIRVLDNEFVDSFENVARTVLKRDLELDDAYLLPNYAGMEYRYSKTDSVFVWTKGGYQIGRNKSDYPVFIDVYEDDVAEWEEFFQGFGIETSVGERPETDGIHFVLYPQKEMKIDRVESASVAPLDETVEWAEKYRANFQPALEMLSEMYDLGPGVEYRERNVIHSASAYPRLQARVKRTVAPFVD